jgi:hypothetical protein
MAVKSGRMMVVAGVIASAGPLPAQDKAAPDRMLDLGKVEVVAAAVRDAGYKAEIKRNSKGEPYIVSAANGSPFTIEFYGCKPDTGCSSLQFYSWFKKKAGFTPELANDWNADKRFLKIYIDKDGDLGTSMDITTTGKLTYANFADVIDWWSVMSADLDAFVEKRTSEGDGK